MSLDLQPGEGILEDGHIRNIDINTLQATELISLMKRSNVLLAAILSTLGKMGNGPTFPGDVSDFEDFKTL